MTTRRVALVALLAALSARELPSQGTRGATDIGRARGLPASARYTPPPDRRPARFPDAWRFPAGRAPVVARNAMVVSDAPIASRVGVDILRRGGNAVNAVAGNQEKQVPALASALQKLSEGGRVG